MKKLIKAVIFISLSLAVHLLVCSFVDASKIARPHYAPMKVTLAQKMTPEQKFTMQKPSEKPKPIINHEPPEQIIEDPPEPEETPAAEPQPLEKQVANVPETIHHELMIKNYQLTVIDIIRENLYYPGSARRRGIEGTVYIRLVLDASGTVSDIQVEKTSGYTLLDKASVKTIRKCIFPPPPDHTLTMSIPITFKLIEDS